MHVQQTILLSKPVILTDLPCPQYIIFYNLTLKQVLFQAADFAQFLEHTVNSVRYILLKHPVVGYCETEIKVMQSGPLSCLKLPKSKHIKG